MPHEFPNDFRLLPPLAAAVKKRPKRYSTFPVLSNITVFLYFVAIIGPRILQTLPSSESSYMNNYIDLI